MMLRSVVIVFGLLLLAGCATAPKNLANFNKNNKQVYPPIGFFITKPSVKLQQECLSFDEASVMQHCRVNEMSAVLYWQQLKESGLFEQVRFAEEGTDYQVLISTANMATETVADITKAALAGATLMLMPWQIEQPVKAEVSLLWRDLLIKRFEYQLNFSHTASLFHQPDAGEKNFAQTLISHFLKDAEQDNIFSGAYLLAALNDSDYITNLQVPDAVEGFVLAGRYIYNDPFFGAQVRYVNEQFHNDYVDVFVYPIKSKDYQHGAALLQTEVNNSRKEMQQYYQQQKLALTLEDSQPISWQTDSAPFNGWYFAGELDIGTDEPQPTSTYLFISGDKFIKLRCTFPPTYAEQLVKTLLPQITVPGESVFMTQVRQRFL